MRMKKMYVVVALCCAVLSSAVFTQVFAQQATDSSNFGNLRQQIKILADQDTDRFIEALEKAITVYFEGKPQERKQFLLIFRTELGLDGYAKDQEGVKEFERLRKFMEENFENGGAEFDKLRTILRIYAVQSP